MSNEQEHQSDRGGIPILQGRFPRRRLLGGMLLGGAGLAMGGFPQRAAAGSVRGRRLQLQADPGGKQAAVAAMRPRGMTADEARASTPDGFLPDSVGGIFASAGPSSIVVIGGPQQRAVTIAITPNTTVFAGGRIAAGDVSSCNPGDHVFVATTFNSVGGRVATFIEVNAATYWATVTAVNGNTLTCSTSKWSDTPNSVVEIEITPATTTDKGLPVPGNGIYCVATKATPSNPTRVWARFIETFAEPTWS